MYTKALRLACRLISQGDLGEKFTSAVECPTQTLERWSVGVTCLRKTVVEKLDVHLTCSGGWPLSVGERSQRWTPLFRTEHAGDVVDPLFIAFRFATLRARIDIQIPASIRIGLRDGEL